MNKKLLTSLALMLVMLLMLGACNSGTPASSAPADAAATKAPAAATDDDKADDTADAEEPAAASDLAPYEINYVMWCQKSSEQGSIVAEAISALIQPKFNATLKFTMIPDADWQQRALVPLQAGEQADIIFTPEWKGYMQNIQNGLLLPLNDPSQPFGDLINTYAPQTVIDLGDFVPANIVNGFLYAVPTNKELCVPGGLIWNKTLVDKYNIDADSIDTYEELEAVLEEFKSTDEYAGGMYPLLTAGEWGGFDPFIQGFMNGMEPLSMYIGEPGANDGEPLMVWETPEMKEHVATMARWNAAGYLHPDAYLTSFSTTDYINAGNFLVKHEVLKGGQVKAKEMMGQSGNPDLEIYEVQTSASVNVTTHAGGSMLGIPITSRDPARAMMYINEMHQNEDLLNLMVWGVEGVHHDLNDQGMVIPKEMNNWTDSNGGPWTMGNQFKQKLGYMEDPAKYDQMTALTNEAWAHESLGFRFDRTGFDNEYAAVQNIMDTYSRSFRCGVNIEAYDTMLAELEAAGLPGVFEATKTQYADWKANK